MLARTTSADGACKHSTLPKVARLNSVILKFVRHVFQPADDNMDHVVFHFEFSVSDPSGTRASDFVVSFPDVLKDNQIRGACFVFDRDERDAFGGAGSLAHDDQPSNTNELVVATARQFAIGRDF